MSSQVCICMHAHVYACICINKSFRIRPCLPFFQQHHHFLNMKQIRKHFLTAHVLQSCRYLLSRGDENTEHFSHYFFMQLWQPLHHGAFCCFVVTGESCCHVRGLRALSGAGEIKSSLCRLI